MLRWDALGVENTKHGQCQSKMILVWQQHNGAMGNGGEPVRTQEKLGELGRCKGETDSDGDETEKDGMIRAHQKKR